MLAEEGGTAIVLGASDSGKTYLTRFLIGDLSSRGRRVGWIDADVGQTNLGPPCTIGMMVCEGAQERGDSGGDIHLHFVGSNSPVGHLLEMVVGTKRLVEKALSLGAQIVIVDTTGLALGPVGTALKTRKVELIRPNFLVALQRGDELEALLKPLSALSRMRLVRLRVGAEAAAKTEGARRDHRLERYKGYFSGAVLRKMSLNDAALSGHWAGTSRRLGEKEKDYLASELKTPVIHAEMFSDVLRVMAASDSHAWGIEEVRRKFGVSRVAVSSVLTLKNRLVALQDEEMEVMGLGVVRYFNGDDLSLSIFTPVKEIGEVKLITLGSIKIEITTTGVKESLLRRSES